VGRGIVSSFAKLDDEGQLDDSFGVNGQVLLPFQLVEPTIVSTSDGSLYVGGNRFVEGELRFFILKMNSGGGIDSSFAGIGFRAFAADAQMQAVDNSLLVLSVPDPTSAPFDYRITKLAEDGSLDDTFGTSGETEIFNPFAPLPAVGDPQLIVDDAGRLAIAAQVYSPIDDNDYLRMVRFTSSGALDLTFGDEGYLDEAIEIEPNWVIVSEQGSGGTSLVVWKTADEQATVVYARRILVDGSADTTFGDGGLLESEELPRAFNRSYEQAPLVVPVGTRQTMVIVSIEDFFRDFRYHSLIIGSDGQFDAAHGGDGVAESTQFNTMYLDAVAPAVLSNGSLRIAAWGYDTSQVPSVDWRVFGLSADGSTETAFGSSGLTSLDFTRTSSYVDGFDVQLTRHSLAAWQSPKLPIEMPQRPDNGEVAISVVRRNGDLNTAHPSGGMLPLGEPLGSETFNWLTERTGDFLTATVNFVSESGPYDSELVLQKLLPSGDVDTSFGSGGSLTIPTHGSQAGSQPIIRQITNGTIYVALATTDETETGWIAKVSDTGQLISAFGDSGVLRLDDASSELVDVAVGGDESLHLLMAEATGGPAAELKVRALGVNGQVETSFGDQGMYTTDMPAGFDPQRIIRDDTGRLLVLYRTGTEMHVRRITTTGQDDASFGTDGNVLLSDEVVSQKTYADMCIYSNQPVVAATTGVFSEVTTVFMLNEDGTPDTSFGQDGVSVLDLAQYGEQVRSVSVLPDASVILGVRTQDRLNSFGVIAKLQGMDPSPVPLHNAYFPLNTTAPDDEVVSPRDALFVIHYLNNRDNYPPGTGPDVLGYIDVNGDGFVSPVDALMVIFALNHGEGEGEGEGDDGAEGERVSGSSSSSARDAFWAFFALPDSGLEDDGEGDGDGNGETQSPYWWLGP
jgi:uncharacterized delta-60 repeat protein